MTQTSQEVRAGKGYCCSYSLKSRRNWTCCRTASGEGNGFSELHLCLFWLFCHLPPVLAEKDLNIPGCRVHCDPSRTQGSSAAVLSMQCLSCLPRHKPHVTLTSHLLATEH